MNCIAALIATGFSCFRPLKHPAAKGPLAAWIREINSARYSTTAQLRERHRSVDFVSDKVIFDIGGNKYRLVARIKYA